MKKLVAVLAMLVTTQAGAVNWVEVARKYPAKVYVDVDSLRPVAHARLGPNELQVEVWELLDTAETASNQAFSAKMLSVYSCNRGVISIKEQVFYKERMGQGKVFRRITEPKMMLVENGGAMKFSVLKFACERIHGKR